ncbi:hypothetical protein LXL04_006605 [Taraxacum kok-saghyz]
MQPYIQKLQLGDRIFFSCGDFRREFFSSGQPSSDARFSVPRVLPSSFFLRRRFSVPRVLPKWSLTPASSSDATLLRRTACSPASSGAKDSAPTHNLFSGGLLCSFRSPNPILFRNCRSHFLINRRAVQMRTIIGGGNGGTNLGHLFQFAADQFSDAGALLSAQHINKCCPPQVVHVSNVINY